MACGVRRVAFGVWRVACGVWHVPFRQQNEPEPGIFLNNIIWHTKFPLMKTWNRVYYLRISCALMVFLCDGAPRRGPMCTTRESLLRRHVGRRKRNWLCKCVKKAARAHRVETQCAQRANPYSDATSAAGKEIGFAGSARMPKRMILTFFGGQHDSYRSHLGQKLGVGQLRQDAQKDEFDVLGGPA